jgi:hypothetical protein
VRGRERKEPPREPVYGVALTDVEIRLLLDLLAGREGPARLDDVRHMLERALEVDALVELAKVAAS